MYTISCSEIIRNSNQPAKFLFQLVNMASSRLQMNTLSMMFYFWRKQCFKTQNLKWFLSQSNAQRVPRIIKNSYHYQTQNITLNILRHKKWGSLQLSIPVRGLTLPSSLGLNASVGPQCQCETSMPVRSLIASAGPQCHGGASMPVRGLNAMAGPQCQCGALMPWRGLNASAGPKCQWRASHVCL